MAIQNGDFIKVNYTGSVDGKIFDTTDEELAKKEGVYQPNGLYGGDIVIVGKNHTITGLDEDFVGKEAGYTGKLEIPPEKAFGLHNEKLVESFSITKFKDRKAYPGMPVEMEGKRGYVSKMVGRRVSVDFNSPLAGKTVGYEYTVEAVIEDTLEKVSGLLALYTGLKDVEVNIVDGIAKINVPEMLSFNHRWLLGKGKIAQEIIEIVEDINEVQLIEVHKKIEAPEAAVEEAPEAAAEE